jgi:hypothetical protein
MTGAQALSRTLIARQIKLTCAHVFAAQLIQQRKAIGALARKNSLWMKFDSTVKRTARDAHLHVGDASGSCRRTFAETLRETRREREP